MPHLTIEYTNNLAAFDARKALTECNRVLTASEQFEEIDVKSRAIRLDTHRVGAALAPRAFVHAKLAILSGRSVETKREISAGLLLVLQEVCPHVEGLHVQLCVEIQEMDRGSYAKVVVTG
jgi:5-carboxymethyl-2-hydroxymuconate isomerase